jgi:DNA-binding MarR family transcriptional regulator
MTMPTDDQLARLGAAFDAFTRRYKLADSLCGGTPLNELDKQALLYVAEHPSCGPTDIARFLDVPKTTVTSATDRLAKRGLLDRSRVEGDRRAVALTLADEGRARVDALLTAHRQINRRLLEPLSAMERDRFIAMITKIVSHED